MIAADLSKSGVVDICHRGRGGVALRETVKASDSPRFAFSSSRSFRRPLITPNALLPVPPYQGYPPLPLPRSSPSELSPWPITYHTLNHPPAHLAASTHTHLLPPCPVLSATRPASGSSTSSGPPARSAASGIPRRKASMSGSASELVRSLSPSTLHFAGRVSLTCRVRPRHRLDILGAP